MSSIGIFGVGTTYIANPLRIQGPAELVQKSIRNILKLELTENMNDIYKVHN